MVKAKAPQPTGEEKSTVRYQENSLHTALKAWYAQPGDLVEAPVDGYRIDVIRGELLVEIQTRNFAALKPKLERLLPEHTIRLVHPIAQEKWIVRLDDDGQQTLSRRKSPRRGRLEHLFLELVRIPSLIDHPNFTLEVLLTREEEIQQKGTVNGRRPSWRRKGWGIADRVLLEVVERYLFLSPNDFRRFLPTTNEAEFSTPQLAQSCDIPRYLAGKMAYCLRQMGLVEACGKRGRANLYRLADRYTQP